MALPSAYVLNQIRKLRGGARVTYPDGVTAVKRVERVVTVPVASAALAFGTADADHTTCVLVYQEIVGQDLQHAEVYRRYEKIPGSVVSGEITHEWGVAKTERQVVAHGTAAESGYLVWQSSVEAEDRNRATKTTLKYADGFTYPTFTDYEFDDRLGVIIPIEKTIVPAGTAGSGTPGSVREIQQRDPWRSIQIAPKINLVDLPSGQSWGVSVRDSFPSELTSLSLSVNYNSGGEYDFNDIVANVQVTTPYSGSCAGRRVRTFSSGPPSGVPTPYQFFPSAVRMLLSPQISMRADSVDTVWEPSATLFNLKVSTLSLNIQECLHAAHTLSMTRTFLRPGSLGGNVTITIVFGSIGATTPAALPHGSEILRDADASPWRFGYWVTEELYVRIP